MTRKLFALSIVGCFVLALALIGPMAQNANSEEHKDAFLIETKVMKPKDLKPGVGFTHKKHAVDYKIACTECHHTYKDDKDVWNQDGEVQKCIECHDMMKTDGKVLKYKLAMHGNCQGCHKKAEAAGQPTGPTKKCNDCHTGKVPK